MSKRCALVQYAHGGHHQQLLSMTNTWHKKYCEIIGADYLYQHPDSEADHSRHWRKVSLLKETLHLGYDKVVWLDCDALIVNRNVNIFDLFGFGVAVCECYDSPSVIRHLNTGVVWAAHSSDTLSFLQDWIEAPNLRENGWQDQDAFIKLMAQRPHRDILTILPNRFNCIESHMEAREPVIRHFAGDADRLSKMAALTSGL